MDSARPIGALTIGYHDEPASGVELSPSADGTAVRLVPGGPLQPTAAAIALSGVAAAPGSYTFSDIRVSYREEVNE